MRIPKTTAPQLCIICNGEFKPRQVRYIGTQDYCVCISCIEYTVIEKIREDKEDLEIQ